MKKRKHQPPKGRHIEHRTSLRVRFQEVDTLQVVWHGHYLTYFEQARVELGRRYGIHYCDIRNAGLVAPIVHVSCDFLAPAHFDEEIEVVARLYERESAKMEFYYEVRSLETQALLATGRTVQVFADPQGDLLLTMPPFMLDFYGRWRDRMRESNE